MTIKIRKLLKSTLALLDDIDVDMEISNGMTIDHYANSVKAASATIPFTIEGKNKHVPQIEKEKWQIVVRKKVDLTATGVNEGEIKGIGKDVGKYKYTDPVPTPPLDLPPGFEEIYRKNK